MDGPFPSDRERKTFRFFPRSYWEISSKLLCAQIEKCTPEWVYPEIAIPLIVEKSYTLLNPLPPTKRCPNQQVGLCKQFPIRQRSSSWISSHFFYRHHRLRRPTTNEAQNQLPSFSISGFFFILFLAALDSSSVTHSTFSSGGARRWAAWMSDGGTASSQPMRCEKQ